MSTTVVDQTKNEINSMILGHNPIAKVIAENPGATLNDICKPNVEMGFKAIQEALAELVTSGAVDVLVSKKETKYFPAD